MADENRKISVNYQELARSTAAWMAYHNLSGLEGILTEHTLTIPIGTYLATRTGRFVESEVAHPINSKSNSDKGRPRQIDLVLSNRKNKEIVFEIKKLNVGFDAVINDILRLLILNDDDSFKSARKVFVICGSQKQFSDFWNRKMNTGGGRSLYFDSLLPKSKEKGLDKKQFSINKDSHKKYIKPIFDFCKNYYPDGDSGIPSSFSCTLDGKGETEGYAAYFWTIRGVQNNRKLGWVDIEKFR